VLDLWRGEHLHKSICNHVFGWAINKTNLAFFNNPSDEMIPNINVLGMSMVLVIIGKCNC